LVPTLFFSAFQPDFAYVHHSVSPLGNPTSAIVAFGIKHGFSVDETIGLFRGEVFEALGYLDAWNSAARVLIDDGDRCGVDLRGVIDSWSTMECPFYTPNHPKLAVLADMARAIALALSMPLAFARPEAMLPDRLSSNVWWPVYPEIGARLGIRGSYDFKKNTKSDPLIRGENLLDLRSFIEGCYKINAGVDPAAIRCERFEGGAFDVLFDLRRAGRSRPIGSTTRPRPDAITSSPTDTARARAVICDEELLDPE
jgi:hypothetical protein